MLAYCKRAVGQPPGFEGPLPKGEVVGCGGLLKRTEAKPLFLSLRLAGEGGLSKGSSLLMEKKKSFIFCIRIANLIFSASFHLHLFLLSSQMLKLLQLPQLSNPPLLLHPYSEKLNIPVERPVLFNLHFLAGSRYNISY